MEEVLRRPGVSVEDVEQVLRLHVDRVHDAARRLGADPEAAVEVVRSSATALVDAVAERPQEVPDAVGWWLAATRRLSRGASPADPDLPLGGGVLSVDDDQLVLAETLEELPEEDRLALLGRDAYRLPFASVAAALGTDEATAASAVARARLRAIPLLDDEPAPPLPAHADSLPALGRLGEGGPVSPRDATVAKHLKACAACADVRAAQERVHLLLAGLTVVALPDDARAAVLGAAEARAREVLPVAAALVLTDEEWEEWDDSPSTLSPVLATLGVLLAVALGAGLGVVMSRGPGAVLPVAANDVLPAVALPPVEAPAPLTLPDLPPPDPIPTPRTTVYFLPPRRSPAPAAPAPAPAAAPSPTSTATATPTTTAAAPSLRVAPSSGPDGATLGVTGSGWTPGGRITVEYLDPAGQPTGSRASAVVDADGTFETELVASNPAGVPGRHTVRAGDGSTTRSAPYDATA
jgi:hypothetical protein